MMTALVVSAALLLDAALGEPRRYHPLVGFGRLAQALERRLYGDSRMRGLSAVILLIAPLTLLALFAGGLPGSIMLDIALLYLAIGHRSLGQHARRVRDALRHHDLDAARQGAGFMVSRDTDTLDRDGVTRATLESVLENSNDALFGALFWFVVAGAPGVVLYRLSNTLDAMWGYRTARYQAFGWAAARLDDLLNYIPARLTALSYTLVGHCKNALHCWQTQGRRWESPNAGPVMAAGAGALGVALGGAARYHGCIKQRPVLGRGAPPAPHHIDAALALVRNATWLWLGVIVISGGLRLA
ncbi:cobalamin biosynthesis protein [Candidatus Tenderia electrophaga]|jgi:adenosylcobinamide-phosphate synthase|uniref:Cobalamin biosynthesis protein CobD n=1 Tax=Candidatus Tenderia electrophaga TaxID=1748243 RepID=A0A0S2TCL5_9GAMM|nr:cobalamin biosynthesis protein [Candidatus Tenderia electrophaga]